MRGSIRLTIMFLAVIIATSTVTCLMIQTLNPQIEPSTKESAYLRPSFPRLAEEQSAENQSTAQQGNYPLTIVQRSLIQQIVMSEAGNQPFDGQAAVAQTIYDRATLWNMSIEDVVTQPAQYALNLKVTPTASVKMAVAYIFDYGGRIYIDPTTHFCTIDCNPYWVEDKVCRGVIARHAFYY